MLRKYFYILLFPVIFAGCFPAPYFQKEEAIPQNAWSYDYRPLFKLDISDTAAKYNTFFVVRHTEAYPYSNIWVWAYTKQPGDTSFHKSRLNIQLAEASGKWTGRGMGEIYEQYMPIIISDSAHKLFKKKGTYEIGFEQNMRINPLPEILHVGLRVEKK